MDIGAIIGSGLLTNYCLGFCSIEEIREIESLSAKHPEIRREIEKLQGYFEEQLLSNAIQPSPSCKIAILHSVYKQEAKLGTQYAPFIDESISIPELENWVLVNEIKAPELMDQDLSFIEMPSTGQVINFIVAAKNGHAREVHTDFTEHLYIINGSCVMDFDGVESPYYRGDIISIKPLIKHAAVVTSDKPMLALVQRQYFV